jgi:hypothetical protein
MLELGSVSKPVNTRKDTDSTVALVTVKLDDASRRNNPPMSKYSTPIPNTSIGAHTLMFAPVVHV